MIPSQYCRQILPPEMCDYIEKFVKEPNIKWIDGILSLRTGVSDIKDNDYGSKTKKVFLVISQIINNF